MASGYNPSTQYTRHKMEISHIIPHLEALIFASDRPLTSLDLTELINSAFGFMEDKVTVDQVEAAVEGIIEKYNSEYYPFEIRQSGGGWQFLTKKAYHKTVAQLNGDKYLKRLSSAALETLAIIAYKQPITKGEIEAIRGVSTDYTIQKLLEKELVIISGRNEQMPGKPLVYSTSKSFMDYFGLNSADDLPRIKEVLADQIIEPTQMQQYLTSQATDAQETPEEAVLAAAPEITGAEAEAAAMLMVSEEGELVVNALPEAEVEDTEEMTAETEPHATPSAEDGQEQASEPGTPEPDPEPGEDDDAGSKYTGDELEPG